ncbi:NmrA domain-containing protein [Mycena venus]|uniref:NmrA domain-containing protein n=1 Tax=Mycena venus TaxID=2733690 RepID=A0A8H6XGW6_9AGAR|nr:NmrA domain-containing protein [Mycena venus]
MSAKKLILVIGATGAQGQAVVEALLAPDAKGNASPYAVRALTRDPTSKHALELTDRGVECVKGSFEDLDSIADALNGVYGTWVNTDGFTVGEMKEIYFGIRIFETAKQAPALRHYVWSSLPYVSKITGFNPDYKVDHMDAKARVADWLRAQPSTASGDELAWSIVTTGPYMELLLGGLFDPLNVRADGTVVFAAPVAGGQIPMIALKDLGWWARYTFDHREEYSGRELNITSERVGWEYLVETFKKVTGKPGVFKPQSLDEWWRNFDDGVENPVASDRTRGDGSRTIRDNFSAFWRVLRDDVVQKDMDWIRRVHPGTYTLERWMRENNYQGRTGTVLKNAQEGRGKWGLNAEVVKLL